MSIMVYFVKRRLRFRLTMAPQKAKTLKLLGNIEYFLCFESSFMGKHIFLCCNLFNTSLGCISAFHLREGTPYIFVC